ncbi:hypothetical protein ES708_23785 [subsurface metagenome]
MSRFRLYIFCFVLATALHAGLGAGLGRIIRFESSENSQDSPSRSIELQLVSARPVPKEPQKAAKAPIQPTVSKPAIEPEPELEPDQGEESSLEPDPDSVEMEETADTQDNIAAPALKAQDEETRDIIPINSSSGDTDTIKPTALEAIEPVYPLGARRRGEEGTVLLEIRVDRRGRVLEVEVIESSGYPLLDRSAEKALERTRFSPARQNGRSIKATIGKLLFKPREQ